MSFEHDEQVGMAAGLISGLMITNPVYDALQMAAIAIDMFNPYHYFGFKGRNEITDESNMYTTVYKNQLRTPEIQKLFSTSADSILKQDKYKDVSKEEKERLKRGMIKSNMSTLQLKQSFYEIPTECLALKDITDPTTTRCNSEYVHAFNTYLLNNKTAQDNQSSNENVNDTSSEETSGAVDRTKVTLSWIGGVLLILFILLLCVYLYSKYRKTNLVRSIGGELVDNIIGDAAEQAAKDAAEQAAKDAAEQAAKDAAEQAARDAAEQAAKDAAEQAAKDAAEQAARDAAEQAAKDAAGEAAEQAIKDTIDNEAKVIAESTADDALKETLEIGSDEAIIASKEEMKNFAKVSEKEVLTITEKVKALVKKYPKLTVAGLTAAGLGLYCAITGKSPAQATKELAKTGSQTAKDVLNEIADGLGLPNLQDIIRIIMYVVIGCLAVGILILGYRLFRKLSHKVSKEDSYTPEFRKPSTRTKKRKGPPIK